ncbi:MAG: hypothetical protein S4CHLAM102_13820 [Chlamydiia bacterium]|nr:hypothetical protein [Chlamydiia bacterium]
MSRSISRFVCLFFLMLSVGVIFASESETTTMNGDEFTPPMIRVLVKENSPGALLEVKGGYKIYNPQNGKQLSSGKKKRYYVIPHKDGIKWGEGFPGIYQVQVVPTSPDSTILVDGIQYKGSVSIYHIDNLVHVINEVDIENLLKSSLNSQLASQKLMEPALEAIAIAMRTNYYYLAQNAPNAFWHVRAEDCCYLGACEMQINPLIDDCIDATRYNILTLNNAPFPTTWNENCAGQTASYQAIFRVDAQTPEGTVSLHAQRDRNKNKWKYEMDKAKISQAFGMDGLTAVDLYIDPHSNKAYALRLTNGSEFKVISFNEAVKVIGSENLKSNDFNVRFEKNTVVFEGFGKGCGVGLCLHSAQEMSELGSTTFKILGNFYPATNLIRCPTLQTASSKGTNSKVCRG